MPPLLSHVITARNDNYLGNFNQRLETVVNYTCAQVAATGNLEAYELLIVDWNSDKPLRNELNLNEAARARTWFLEVPPETVREYGFHRRPPGRPVYSFEEAFKGDMGQALPASSVPQEVAFNPGAAANVGFRRARGDFVIYSPADVFFPFTSVKNLFALLRGEMDLPADIRRCYLGLERFLVPWQRSGRLATAADLDRYIALHSAQMSFGLRHHGHCGSEGACLTPRRLLHEIRGYNELYTDWGFHDTELGRRLGQTAPMLKGSVFGLFTYDFQQRPRLRTKGITRANLDRVELSPVDNDENWGLGSAEIPYQPALHRPEIKHESEAAAPYDLASLLEMNPARPSLTAKAWRGLMRRNIAGLEPARLFNLAGKLKKRSLFSRLGFESLLTQLEREEAFGPWFGDRAELFSYFQTALDKGLHRLISRWNPEQACTLLAVLATVGRRRPARVFYVGMRDFYVAQAAAAVDPTLEISAYDHWSTELYPTGHGSPRLYYYGHISTALKEVGFQGYLHVETGPLETAFERLAATPLAGDPFEALFLDLDFLAPLLEGLTSKLAPLMTAGCALVLRGRADRLESAAASYQGLDFQPAGQLPGLLVLIREVG